MAATGEPYNVAARAIDAPEPTAEPAAQQPGPAEPGTQEPGPAERGTQEPGPAEPDAQQPGPAEPGTQEPGPGKSGTSGPADGERLAAEPVAADPPDDRAAEAAADPAGALAEVIACASRTLTAPSARIEIRTDTDLGRDPGERVPRRRRRGLLGRLAEGVLGRVAPEMDAAEVREAFLHQFGAGFIEPAARRYLVDFGGYAQVLVDGRRFGGLSGEPLGPRFELRPHRFRRDDPLDALRKLQGAKAASWTGEERVRWTTCRVAVTTAGPDEFTVWVDDQRIRRFRTVERGSGRSVQATRTETVEFWDFGVPVDSLDWSRLPDFRTPARSKTVGD